MNLAELRALEPKDLLNWPLRAQLLFLALMLFVLFGLSYWLILSDKLGQLNQAQAQEIQLKQNFIDKKRQAVNLDALQKQLNTIQASFGSLLKQLPTKSDMDNLLTEINQAGVGRGLQFELFKPNPEIKSTEMAQMPITIRLTGSFNDLATFVSDVAQLSRIVTITDITLTPVTGSHGTNRLTLDATAKTFRALEPEERLAQAVVKAKP